MEQSPQRVLVVDDNKDAADSAALLLQHMGYTVRQAYDGPSAVVLAADFKPQCVLLDLMMPKVDGFEVARRLREMDETRDAKIFALTGHGEPPFREATDEARFDGHLLKPVSPEELSQALTSARDA